MRSARPLLGSAMTAVLSRRTPVNHGDHFPPLFYFTGTEARLGGIATPLSAIENRIGGVKERMSTMLRLSLHIAEQVAPHGWPIRRVESRGFRPAVSGLPLGAAELVEASRILDAAVVAAVLVPCDLPPSDIARETIARLRHRPAGKAATAQLQR